MPTNVLPKIVLFMR